MTCNESARPRALVRLAAALCAILLSPAALAQSVPGTEPPRSEQRVQPVPAATPTRLQVQLPDARISSVRRPLAPLTPDGATSGRRPLLVLTPSIAVEEQFSDNFLLDDRDPRDNWRTIAVPGAQLAVGNGPASVELGYRMGVVHDSEPSDFSYHHGLSGEASWRMAPRLELRVVDDFLDTDEPREADKLGLRNERDHFQRNTFNTELRYASPTLSGSAFVRVPTFRGEGDDATTTREIGAGFQKALGPHIVVSGGYTHLTSAIARNDRDADVDVDGHEWTLNASRLIRRIGSAGILTRYAIRTADAETEGSGNDVALWSVLPYVSVNLGRDLALSLGAGLTRLSADRGRDFSALGANGALRFQRGRIGAEVSLSSGFSETFTEGENFGIVKTFALDGALAYKLTPRITVRGGSFYRRNRPLGLVFDLEDENEERLWGMSYELRFAVRRWLDASLEYGFTRASLSRSRYTENRVVLGFRSSFD